ncbi:hypothetical protein HMPREF1870_01412 [Bacteroidales bacterium KA00344]|nr:hypothetical protein HMPREF1870_01412 [Bacteroidales bacterium KA00344]
MSHRDILRDGVIKLVTRNVSGNYVVYTQENKSFFEKTYHIGP